MRRSLALMMLTAALAPVPVLAAPAGPGQAVEMSCSGPQAETGRKLSAAAKFAVGAAPGACFGRMSMYDGSDKNLVVSAPSPKCPGAKLIDIYQQARSGTWGSVFAAPVCGSKVVVGPKDPWGAWMITIDNRHYDQRGAYYELVSY